MNQLIVHVKTAIIGAGVAGMAAASTLLNHKHDQFLVFEGLERTGGRVCTETTDKGYYEIGAQWIHGQKGNPIYEIAQRLDLVKKGYEEVSFEDLNLRDAQNLVDMDSSKWLKKLDQLKDDSDKVIFVTQNGQKITTSWAKSVYDTLTKIINEAEVTSASAAFQTRAGDARVGDFIYDKYIELVRRELGSDKYDSDPEVRRVVNGLFLMRAKRENIRSGCSNLFNLSMKNFSAFKHFPGQSYVELSKGYTPIINSIIPDAAKFQSRLRLKHIVKKIIVSPELAGDLHPSSSTYLHKKYTNESDKVVLLVCDASDPQNPRDLTVICDNVLCTMSLGFLKENLNTLFEPLSLVSEKRRSAVQRLGFGTINKIFLFYDDSFWNEKALELVNMIWLPESDEFRLEKLSHANASRKHWYEDISKFEASTSHPNTLVAWVAGSEEFEKLDEATIAGECTRLLRKFLNNEQIPEPSRILRSEWHSNVFSRGSYSHLPLGSSPDDLDQLARPMPSEKEPKILFAGEHTNRDYYSTTHGAYLTGVREAQRLIDTMKQ